MSTCTCPNPDATVNGSDGSQYCHECGKPIRDEKAAARKAAAARMVAETIEAAKKNGKQIRFKGFEGFNGYKVK